MFKLSITPAVLLVAVSGLAFAIPATAQEAVSAPARAPSGQAPEHLPIKRITLYRSGVGSFERRGLVDGDASVQLRFKTEQINDILKSMFVLDLSRNGTIDGISYGSKEPLTRRLGSFAIDISANPSLADILGALRGTEVTVSLPDANATGVILGTETKLEPTGKDTPPIAVEYLNLVTPSGIRSIKLSLANSVELKDKELNAELAKALAAVAEYRADRTKTVDVNLRGEGAREVVIAYVQESPVWKTSYRLILPDTKSSATADPKPAEADKPSTKNSGNSSRKPDPAPAPKSSGAAPDRFTIQGWAIVENTTDDDWKDVTLSLVSGRPVSFRMDLYEPLYVFRPEIPVPTVPGVMPRAYEGGAAEAQAATQGLDVAGEFVGRRAPGQSKSMPAPASAPAERAEAAGMAFSRVTSEEMANYAAQSQAKAVEAGEVFQFELDHPVTVERQRSAMLPILASGIDGRRVSIFNPGDGSEHPMRGLELTNSTGLQLMPGPISVYDAGSYAGDAQIGHVPAGDKRLLAYSVDLDVIYKRDDNSTENIRKVRIVQGALEVTFMRQMKTAYTFTNKDQSRDRTLIVEQQRSQGWTLTQPEKPYETTDALYRFELPVSAAKQATIAIVQERTESRTLAITSIDLPTLIAYSRQGQVSDKVIESFKAAAALQARINDHERQIESLEKQRTEIDTDQSRIRQNMNSIDHSSELYKRYMQKLTEQETRVEQLTDSIAQARTSLEQARNELNTMLAGLNVE